MKKILSIFAAALVAIAVNAQTDFASPGYSCAADDAVLANVYGLSLVTSAEPHYIQCAEATYNVVLATWTVSATRGCYISASLDMGPAYGSNKHIFEVTIKDSKGNTKGTLVEAAESTAADQVVDLLGTILIPVEGEYTVELISRRQYGKGTIKNIILTYAADAPSEIIEVSSVELNKTELALDIQEVEQLSATVSPDDATDPSVTWTSSDEAVATVSDGFVTAIAAGTATITAKAGKKSATCAVTVAAAPVPEVKLTSTYTLAAKNAHLEGKIWKKYEDSKYKLYGDGGHNEQYGNALWTIHVTNPCIISASLMDVGGGCLYELDVFKGEDSITTVIQPAASKWWSGIVEMDGTITLAEAGKYTFRLRNTLEWSSGKTSGISLIFKENLAPALPYMAIIGDMNGWAGDELVPAEDKLTASATINLAMNANSGYGFKVLVDGKAYCIKPGAEWYSFHRGWTSASGIDHVATDEEAFWLSIDKAGDYTFTWTIAEKKLDITFPDLENITYYFVNTPDWTEVHAYAWDPMITAWPGDVAVLQLGVSKNGHNVWAYTMPENRRHIIFNDGTGGEGHQTANLDVEDNHYYYKDAWYASLDAIPTEGGDGIDDIDAAVKAVKVIRGGQLFIEKNGVLYNAQGTVVK